MQAWRNRETDPSAYYVHFRDPGEKLRPHGAWSAAEHTAFIARLDTFKANDWTLDASWGLFSRALVGRTGLECRQYYHTLLRNGVLFDPAYSPDGSVCYLFAIYFFLSFFLLLFTAKSYELHKGKLHRISELPSAGVGSVPRSEIRLSDAWRNADVQRVANRVDILITKIHPTVCTTLPSLVLYSTYRVSADSAGRLSCNTQA